MALPFPEVDEELVEKIVDRLKSQGIFDQFRKDCLADVDSRPAYQNLRDKVNGAVADFLSKQAWKDELNKNQVRESLRKHVQQHYLEVGVNKIVEQVVNPKIFSVFMPKVEDIVYQVMGIEKPTNAEDRSHNRLRFLMSNNIPHPSPGNVFSEILPSDLDPISPGSINESANLNDSIINKTIDECDNVSHDLNKESNLDVNEASNESKVSGISELSSHGSTTKLDISESAHLPGDKSGMNCDVISIQSNLGNAERSKGANENIAGGYDFDNFSNLKEKLLKTDPLNKNLDKEKIDSSTTNKTCEVDSWQNEEFKQSKDITSSENAEEIKTEKIVKSPISCLYSEDSIGSNCSHRSKMKTDKIHLLNESTRNSLVMDCQDSSVSFTDKKFEGPKEAESVSCIESLKEESQMSIASNDSRKFNNFANLKLNSENSQNRSTGSSPDLAKNISNDRKKEYIDRKGSSHSTHRSGDRYDSKHKSSRNSSRDRKHSKDSKSKHESDKKYSSSSRDKYSSRSRDDRHRSDSKSEKKSNYDDSKRDSKHTLSSDDKNRKDKESKSKSEDDRKIITNRGKESQNSSDDDRRLKKGENKNSDKEKNSKTYPDKTSKDDSKSSAESKVASKKDDTKRNAEDLKSSKANDSKGSSDDRKSSKEKMSRTSEDDKHYKRDKDVKKDDYRSSRNKDKSSSKSSNDKESKSSPLERKNSNSRNKDSKQGSEEERSSRKDKDIYDKSVKSSDNMDEDKNKSRSDVNDKSFKNDKKQNHERKGESSDRKKGSNETVLKKEDKDLKKRKRENCSEDIEKKESRRSRDRDDGNHRNSGHSSSREHKDSDKKRKSGSTNKQEKTVSSNSKENSSKDQVDSNTSNISANQIDMILKRIDSSIQADTNNIVNENIIESNEYNFSNTSNTPFHSKKPIIDFDTSEKQFPKKSENSDKIQEDNQLEILNPNSKGKDCVDVKINENSDSQIIINSKNEENINTQVKMDDSKDILSLSTNSTEMHLTNLNENITVNNVVEDEFHGFDQSSTSDSFIHAMNFTEFMKSVYCLESSLCNPSSDKYFSLTDNNLNNIDYKNDLTILINEDRLCNTTLIPNCPVDDKIQTVLSPVTKSVVYNLWNQPAQVPQDGISQNGSCCTSKVTDLTSRIARKNVEDLTGKTTEYLITLKDAGQTKRNEDAMSLSENWSSERGFTLPSVTEDMLDNFMMENIIDKLDGCYNSSDSEVESWNVPVTPDAILLTDGDEEPSNKKDESVSGVSELLAKKSSEEKIISKTSPRSNEDKTSSPSKSEEDVKRSDMRLKEDSKKIHSEDPNQDKEPSPPRAKETKKLPSVHPKHDDNSSTLQNKDDKTLPRVSQRYNDGDLYKPRPLITNPSRRNRVASKNGSKPTRGMKRMGDSLEFSENKRPR